MRIKLVMLVVLCPVVLSGCAIKDLVVNKIRPPVVEAEVILPSTDTLEAAVDWSSMPATTEEIPQEDVVILEPDKGTPEGITPIIQFFSEYVDKETENGIEQVLQERSGIFEYDGLVYRPNVGELHSPSDTWSQDWYEYESKYWGVYGYRLEANNEYTVYTYNKINTFSPTRDNLPVFDLMLTDDFGRTAEELWYEYGSPLNPTEYPEAWAKRMYHQIYLQGPPPTESGVEWTWIWNDSGTQGLWIQKGVQLGGNEWSNSRKNANHGHDLRFGDIQGLIPLERQDFSLKKILKGE